jgi:hypothetical protein
LFKNRKRGIEFLDDEVKPKSFDPTKNIRVHVPVFWAGSQQVANQ